MTALGEVVIGAVELLEAEARKLSSDARALVGTVLLALLAGVLLLMGAGWLMAAAYLQLRVWLSPAAASGLLGLIALLSGGLLWYTTRKT